MNTSFKSIKIKFLILGIVSIFYGACQASEFDSTSDEDLDQNELAPRLFLAARYGEVAKMSVLLALYANNTDIEQRVKQQNFDEALCIAANNFSTEVVQLLLEAGANADFNCYAACGHYNSALHMALRNCLPKNEMACLPIVTKLLAVKTKPDAQFFDPITPLNIAVTHELHAMVKILLLFGVDPNIQNSEFRTALHDFLEKIRIVRIFLPDGKPVMRTVPLSEITPQFISPRKATIIKTLLVAGTNPDIETSNWEKASTMLVKLEIDPDAHKPNLTYTIRQVAYQKYIKGDPSMLYLLLGLDTERLASIQASGGIQDKVGTLNHAIAQNREFFEDVLEQSFWQKAAIDLEKRAISK